MLLPDLQMVLDRLAMNYDGVSPQILRSAVEYTKMSAVTMPVEEDDPSAGKDALYARAQSYVEGYCKVYDGFYNPNALDIATTEATRHAMDSIREDFGEESPTYLISACGDYLVTLATSPMGIPKEQLPSLLLSSAVGFMDGALEAEMDKDMNRYIKPVYSPYPTELAEQAYDIIADEVDLKIGDEDTAKEIKQVVCADLTRMMRHLLYPRSGNSEIQTEDSLACAMMYLGGYIKGLIGADERGIDIEKFSKLTEEQEQALLVADAILALWCRYRGYGDSITKDASAAMRDNVLTDNLFFDDVSSSAAEISMSALYAIGYSDGRWFSSADDDVDEKKLSEMEISDEVDLIFATMLFRKDDA